MLIARAFRHQFIIPDFQGFAKDLEEVYWKCKGNNDGKVGRPSRVVNPDDDPAGENVLAKNAHSRWSMHDTHNNRSLTIKHVIINELHHTRNIIDN